MPVGLGRAEKCWGNDKIPLEMSYLAEGISSCCWLQSTPALGRPNDLT